MLTTQTKLTPLLGKAFPANRIEPEFHDLFARLEQVIETDIAPMAKEVDAAGRYPTKSIAALKTTGVLHQIVPSAFGGVGVPSRVSMEIQLRLAIADSAVAQLYKVHDEIVREIYTYCPEGLKPRLASAILSDDAIIGLAVAESGKTVTDPMKTTALRRPEGGFTIEGVKIYTTAAAEADYIAVWAFNPQAEGVDDNPLNGLQLNLVPPSTPGVTIHRDWDALGQRGTDSGMITFADVKTDPDWMANEPGRVSPVSASLRYQLGFCAIMIGNAIGALREAAAFVPAKSRPWPSAGVDNAADDLLVRRTMGELTAPLVAAYSLMMDGADLLDEFEAGNISRTDLAIPVYAAKIAADKAALAATSDVFALMGTRSVAGKNGFDRYWRNVRTIALHDPVNWKQEEIGRHLLTGWEPEPGLYQ
ncbi:acyl-CoA dehydrogenase family protein [Hoeflea sp. WL0058]|uniref:Dibenzothiophene monooxygenase n=1 Tax=Flavimaribacter sediminis TaxID=2865987 RepID=A0AAE2ZUL0_9HYPH|nr:acyl-CoA dehydrogenase family protein [Flavimaribacter sediminis]